MNNKQSLLFALIKSNIEVRVNLKFHSNAKSSSSELFLKRTLLNQLLFYFTTVAPHDYYPEKCNFNSSPAYTMSSRLNIAKSDEVPAPNAYDLNKMKVVDTPAYTFAGKGYNPKKDDTPGE